MYSPVDLYGTCTVSNNSANITALLLHLDLLDLSIQGVFLKCTVIIVQLLYKRTLFYPYPVLHQQTNISSSSTSQRCHSRQSLIPWPLRTLPPSFLPTDSSESVILYSFYRFLLKLLLLQLRTIVVLLIFSTVTSW